MLISKFVVGETHVISLNLVFFKFIVFGFNFVLFMFNFFLIFNLNNFA